MTLTQQLDSMLSELDTLTTASADLVARVQACLLADDVPSREDQALFDSYLSQSRRLARSVAALVKQGAVPSPVVKAEADTALTRDLVNAAEAAGYSIETDTAWTQSHTRAGVLVVKHDGRELRRITWDIGSARLPAPRYRVGSRHHQAVLTALRFIEDRSPHVFTGY